MQAVTQAHDQRHVVVDDQKPELLRLRQGREQLEQARRLGLVHARRRLVEQKEGRRRGERAGDLDAPLVAVAEAAGERLGARTKAELGEQAVGDRARRRPAQAAGDRAGLDVLAHGQVPEQPHDLERPGDAPRRDLARRQPGDVLAAAQHPPLGRLQLAGQDVHERGLARAVGSDQAEDLAGLEAERHPIEGAQAGELDRHGHGFEDGCGHGRSRNRRGLAGAMPARRRPGRRLPWPMAPRPMAPRRSLKEPAGSRACASRGSWACPRSAR